MTFGAGLANSLAGAVVWILLVAGAVLGSLAQTLWEAQQLGACRADVAGDSRKAWELRETRCKTGWET